MGILSRTGQVSLSDATMTIGRVFGTPDDTGIHQITVTSEDAAAVAALPPGSALLIVQSGSVVGERFLLNAPTVVAGRSSKADIFFDDVTVSRKHAEFQRTADGYSVRDAKSLNGTYVNRQRIDGEALLQSGDEVQIGKFKMSYQHSPNQE